MFTDTGQSNLFFLIFRDMRNNLRYIDDSRIVYNAAALGIVLNMDTNIQAFYNEHEDDIIAFDMY